MASCPKAQLPLPSHHLIHKGIAGMLQVLLEKLLELTPPGLLAVIGGIAKYLRTNLKDGREFSSAIFVMNIGLAFLVGIMAGAWVDETNRFRDGIMMLCGYCTYPILDFMEERLMSGLKKIKP